MKKKIKNVILLSSLSLGLVLELIIGHRNNGEDQVDEVERTKENVEDKESDVERPGCLERDLKTNNNNHLLPLTLTSQTWYKFSQKS